MKKVDYQKINFNASETSNLGSYYPMNVFQRKIGK